MLRDLRDRMFQPRFTPYIARDRRCGGDVFDFWISDAVAKEWYDATADQTLPEKLWCRDHIRSGNHVVDVGAHHGMMSVLFSKWTGPTGRVTSYEIFPDNRSALARNLELNHCANVTIRPYGVGERTGAVRGQHNNSGNVTVLRRGARFDVVALEDDLRGRRVDFLKIDVEGSELAVLRGARSIIRQQRPTICLELHNFLFVDRLAELREIMAELPSEIYRFELLEQILGIPRPTDGAPAALAVFDNPHLFCVAR